MVTRSPALPATELTRNDGGGVAVGIAARVAVPVARGVPVAVTVAVGTAVHVPWCPSTAQDSPSLQAATMQHVLSTQKPEVHWAPFVHGLEAGAGGLHCPA
ncbi:MAG: hypothetical protein ACHQ4J_15590 [Candidatus Binatia bacterium]